MTPYLWLLFLLDRKAAANLYFKNVHIGVILFISLKKYDLKFIPCPNPNLLHYLFLIFGELAQEITNYYFTDLLLSYDKTLCVTVKTGVYFIWPLQCWRLLWRIFFFFKVRSLSKPGDLIKYWKGYKKYPSILPSF